MTRRIESDKRYYDKSTTYVVKFKNPFSNKFFSQVRGGGDTCQR